MLQYESSLLTQMAHMIRVNGWAPLVVKSDRAEGQKPLISMTPGVVNYIEETEDVKYLEFGGQTMAVVERLINAVDGYVDKGSGLGDILRGAPKGKSGYQQAQLASMAKVALVPIEQTTTRTLNRASRLILKMIRLLDDTFTVHGRFGAQSGMMSLSPKDVLLFGEIDTRMKTILPIDEGAKIANYQNMVKAGWLSRVTAARLAGIENPEDEHARWIAEEIAALPEIQQAQAMQYLQEHDPQLFALMQQLQQQHQGPGGGQPNTQMGPGGPGGAGGGAKPGQPGAQPSPPAAGSRQESNQVQRQAAAGGQAPKRLRDSPDE